MIRRKFLGCVLTVGLLFGGVGAFAPSLYASESTTAIQAPRKCQAGAPSLAVRVGWKEVDTFYLNMQTHVQILNCRGRVKSVRIIVKSLRAGGTGKVEQDVTILGTQPSRYANKAMMVHLNQFLRVVDLEGDAGQGKGVVLDDKRSFYNLQSCTLMTDGRPIDTSDFSFLVRVEPLDGKRKVIPDVGAAVIGPFACGQLAGT